MRQEEDDHTGEHRPIGDAIQCGIKKSAEFGAAGGELGNGTVQ